PSHGPHRRKSPGYSEVERTVRRGLVPERAVEAGYRPRGVLHDVTGTRPGDQGAATEEHGAELAYVAPEIGLVVRPLHGQVVGAEDEPPPALVPGCARVGHLDHSRPGDVVRAADQRRSEVDQPDVQLVAEQGLRPT